MEAGLRHKVLFAVITIASILFIASFSSAQDGKQTPDDKKTWTVTLPFDPRFCAGSGMTMIDLPFGTAPGSGARKVLKTEKTSKGTKETYTDGTWIEWEVTPQGVPRMIREKLQDGSVIDWESGSPKKVENQTSSTTEHERSCNEGLLDAVLKADTGTAGTPRVSPEPAKAEENQPGILESLSPLIPSFGFGIGGGRGERSGPSNPCAIRKK